jgi:glycosyltransferase involved in cell wall biosynthesis
MNQLPDSSSRAIAVVIPCYKSGELVLDVIRRIGPEVGWIFVIDDCCPIHTGQTVLEKCADPRVTVLFHAENEGVGGAVITGYNAAVETAASVAVKIDGDGQMAPELIPQLCSSILSGQADYAKGNRFHIAGGVASMPALRLIGNIGLSFITKASSGYWQLFDPTNGYTAIHTRVLSELDTTKIARRYFFESDMLFRLNLLRAVVAEMPMKAIYEGEPSSLSPMKIIAPFLKGNARNFFKRIVYRYFISDFSLASLELVAAIPLLAFGIIYGIDHLIANKVNGATASAGIVMASALPIILGFQLLLSWLNYDVSTQPVRALHPQLPPLDKAE